MLPGAAGFPGDSSPFSGVDIGIVIFQKVNNSWQSFKSNKVHIYTDLGQLHSGKTPGHMWCCAKIALPHYEIQNQDLRLHNKRAFSPGWIARGTTSGHMRLWGLSSYALALAESDIPRPHWPSWCQEHPSLLNAHSRHTPLPWGKERQGKLRSQWSEASGWVSPHRFLCLCVVFILWTTCENCSHFWQLQRLWFPSWSRAVRSLK